jgi:hypothetical protein
VPTSRCLQVRPIFAAAALVATTAFLGGCGGSQSLSPQGPTQANAAGAMHSTPIEPDICRSSGGVRVAPCKVRFTVSNPGPFTVIVRTPQGTKGMLQERNKCGGASGIATVMQGSGNSWTVTAGSTTGSCKARFTYFNHGTKVGWAVLRIINSL